MKLLLFLCSISAYAQATVNAPAVQLDANGSTAVLAWMAGQVKPAGATRLQSNITAGATSATVVDAAGIAVNDVIAVGVEHLGVSAKSGNVLTVARGFNGSTAASHDADAPVSVMRYRTLNLLGKAIIVDAMRAIVRQERQTAINAAIAQANAETEAAVQ